jgi:hypothetical protein
MTFNISETQATEMKNSIDKLLPVVNLYLNAVINNTIPVNIINVLGINVNTIEDLLNSLKSIFEILKSGLEEN